MTHQDEERTITVDSRFAPKAVSHRPTEPCIVFLTGTLTGVTYWLSSHKELIIGRAPETDVCIQDQRVSRRHARMGIAADGAIFIEDLGSTNGTYVNGDKITRRALQNGDKVHIGPHYMLKFCYEPSPVLDTSRQGGIDQTLDALTGVYARQFLLARLDEVFSDVQKQRGDLILLMFDVDGFKTINNAHGERAGDLVLQEIVKLVGPALRREDVLARYENDSFAIFPQNPDESAAVVLAQRVRRAVKYHDFVHGDTKLSVTVSIGISVLTKKMKNAQDLIKDVEAELKRAKSKGQDNINGSQSIRSILRHIAQQRVA